MQAYMMFSSRELYWQRHAPRNEVVFLFFSFFTLQSGQIGSRLMCGTTRWNRQMKNNLSDVDLFYLITAPTLVQGNTMLKRVKYYPISIRSLLPPSHSTLNLTECGYYLFIHLSPPNELQADWSTDIFLGAIHFVHETVLLVLRDIAHVLRILHRVHCGHREDDTWVV